MKKILYVGNNKTYGGGECGVFLKMEYTKGNLSISGVEGPLSSGNCLGGAGQIVDTLLKIEPAPGYTRATLKRLHDYWEEWHLNDLQAGCEHQRAEHWEDVKLDDSKPLTQDNMATWKRENEHPRGLLCKPCPVCGYKYGTQWLKKEVPASVINWLFSLPDSPITPAWV